MAFSVAWLSLQCLTSHKSTGIRCGTFQSTDSRNKLQPLLEVLLSMNKCAAVSPMYRLWLVHSLVNFLHYILGLQKPLTCLIREHFRRPGCCDRKCCIWRNIHCSIRERESKRVRERRREQHYGLCPEQKISCDSCLLCLSRPSAISQCGLFADTKVVMDLGFISKETCGHIGLCSASGTGGKLFQ